MQTSTSGTRLFNSVRRYWASPSAFPVYVSPSTTKATNRNAAVYRTVQPARLKPTVYQPDICDKLHRHFLEVTMAAYSTGGSRDEKQKLESPQTFQIFKAAQNSHQQSKTLVVMFGFYGASERAITNYCALYHRYGFDATYVKSFLKHFAWPNNSVELAHKVLAFLAANCGTYDKFVIHAFSMGAYNFTVCMGEMYSNPVQYSPIQSRIQAVIYDSLTIGSLKNMARGVGLGISQNTLIQAAIPLSISLYFRLTHNYTVRLYDHFIDIFKQKPLQIPTLLYCCKDDPMSEFDVVETMINNWKRRYDFPIVCKAWDKSKHSAHLREHKEDYTKTLDTFLQNVPGLLNVEPKL